MKITTSGSVSLFCILLCLSGCYVPTVSWVSSARPALDADAKTFQVSTDASNIYVISDWGWEDTQLFLLDDWDGRFYNGLTMAQTLTRDEKRLLPGKTLWLDHNHYRLLRVKPGQHELRSRTTLSLTTEAGRNYFVRFRSRGGFWVAQQHTWEILSEEEGRALVLKAKLADRHRSIPP
jgi:hypothetical protein